MRRLFHHQAGQVDGIRDVLERSDRSCVQRAAIHDRCIHLRNAFTGVVGTPPCVKQAGILHDANCRLHCIQAGALFRQNRVAGLHGLEHGAAAHLGLLSLHAAVIARATMRYQHKARGWGCRSDCSARPEMTRYTNCRDRHQDDGDGTNCLHKYLRGFTANEPARTRLD